MLSAPLERAVQQDIVVVNSPKSRVLYIMFKNPPRQPKKYCLVKGVRAGSRFMVLDVSFNLFARFKVALPETPQ